VNHSSLFASEIRETSSAIQSDEVATATEESKDPYNQQKISSVAKNTKANSLSFL
jgi:hypothetical protein